MRASRLVGVGAWIGVAACSTVTPGGAACYPGDYVYCACDGGAGDGGVQGYSECPADGGDYGACNCAGIHPADIDGASLVCDPDAGKLPLLCACTSNDDCASGDCFPFNAKGPHCTTACTEQSASTVCPAGSGGCNMMGVCMVP